MSYKLAMQIKPKLENHQKKWLMEPFFDLWRATNLNNQINESSISSNKEVKITSNQCKEAYENE